MAETPEEWAERTGQGRLSPEELDLRATQLWDGIGFRQVVPPEAMARLIEIFLAKVDEKAEVEFVGNWWVEGNPYKGVNVALREREHYVRFEVQFHTAESARLAEANHDDYEILRDPERPLGARQEAFDRMVASFAEVPHPPGIEEIGAPVVKSRPVAEPEKVDAREKLLSDLTPKLEELAARVGGRVEIDRPEYRPDLLLLLEKGRRALQHRRFRTAIATFDELVERFGDDPARWSKRGVANALNNSGVAFLGLGRRSAAIERFDRVIEMGRNDPEVGIEAANAEIRKRDALSTGDDR